MLPNVLCRISTDVLFFLLTGSLFAQQLQPAITDSFPRATAKNITIAKAAAIDLDFQGNVYILDRGRHQLLKFNPAGELIGQVGGFGQGEDGFDNPLDVVANSALDIFIADYNNRRVVRFDKNLNYLSQLTAIYDPPNDFERVLSIAISPQYDLFLLEDRENRILKFSRFSEPTAVFGGLNDPYGQLLEPTDLALGDNLHLFVADPGQQAVVVFDYLGNYVRQLKHPDFRQPRALYFDRTGKLFVTDPVARSVFVFERGQRFLTRLDLSFLKIDLVSAAAVPGKTPGSIALYVLSGQRCYRIRFSLPQ